MAETLEELSATTLFQKISDICSSVNVTKDSRELLDTSLHQVMELFGAQRGSIFILSENKKELVLKAARGLEVDEKQKLVKLMGQGIVGRVAETKKPVVVEDIAKDRRFGDLKPRRSYRGPSFICAPLMVKDKLIGVINITDKESGLRFNKDELQLLDFLSTQIALNYRRVNLYQKFKSLEKESELLKTELGKSSAEAKNLKKQIVVQEKLASIGKLAGGIAHEFNNPLDGVIRYTNLSLQHLNADDEVVRGYLLEIKQGLNRMANIVKSLLACSRNASPSMRTIDVHQKIEQSILEVQPEVVHKNITIEKKIAGTSLPLIDYGFELIISNLLRNSIDAVDNGGKIRLSTLSGNGFLSIKVWDNGRGIPEELSGKIFEPFFTTKDIEKGCGLGLTIVSEIVKSYNGDINVKSSPKEGTTFTITIPVASQYEQKDK